MTLVCAETPGKDTFPELYQTVTKFMMHGPCGVANPILHAWRMASVQRSFLKISQKLTMECDGYPQYRRRDDGKYIMKNGVPLDNRHIVPYNPYLSKKYNAHINIEICSTINSCKYLYKYVYKGPDMASVQVVDNQGDALDNTSDTQPKEQDEIKHSVNLQFITASESYWHISGYDVHGCEPSIQRLAVHEENMQTVFFQENDFAEAITNPKNTTLLTLILPTIFTDCLLYPITLPSPQGFNSRLPLSFWFNWSYTFNGIALISAPVSCLPSISRPFISIFEKI